MQPYIEKTLRHKVFIIAEAGVNHNGSLSMAFKLIDAAKTAGADAIKFQSFYTDDLVVPEAPKVLYQRKKESSLTQYEMLKRLELTASMHEKIVNYCNKRNILFLSTPFDIKSLSYLVQKFKMPLIKVASGELTHDHLLLCAARTQKPMLLSTGMSTLKEIKRALKIIAFGYLKAKKIPTLKQLKKIYSKSKVRKILEEKVVLLHCVSEYPASDLKINLNVMKTLKKHFGLEVGYSDHSSGIVIPIAAVALGARVIEKHLTLDNNLPGPDHEASLEPKEFLDMVRSIRIIERALGNGKKKPTPVEIKNKKMVRKGVYAKRYIPKGKLLSLDDMICKRPEAHCLANNIWNMINIPAKKNFNQNDPIL